MTALSAVIVGSSLRKAHAEKSAQRGYQDENKILVTPPIPV